MPKKIIALKVNGTFYELAIEPQITLIEMLREHLGLTGSKFSCGVGECGSCTVLVDERPVLSCCTLAIAVRDKSIITIEGLSKPSNMDSLQKAFVEKGAIQCGFCTPGMVITAKAFLNKNQAPTRIEIKKALAGNLCRCSGYIKIVDAVSSASQFEEEKR